MKRLIKLIASLFICLSLSFISIKNNKAKAKTYTNSIEIKCENKVSDTNEGKLSMGAEVAIVLGAIIVSSSIGIVMYLLVFKKKKNKN